MLAYSFEKIKQDIKVTEQHNHTFVPSLGLPKPVLSLCCTEVGLLQSRCASDQLGYYAHKAVYNCCPGVVFICWCLDNIPGTVIGGSAELVSALKPGQMGTCWFSSSNFRDTSHPSVLHFAMFLSILSANQVSTSILVLSWNTGEFLASLATYHDPKYEACPMLWDSMLLVCPLYDYHQSIQRQVHAAKPTLSTMEGVLSIHCLLKYVNIITWC